jgi:hypothetical protein
MTFDAPSHDTTAAAAAAAVAVSCRRMVKDDDAAQTVAARAEHESRPEEREPTTLDYSRFARRRKPTPEWLLVIIWTAVSVLGVALFVSGLRALLLWIDD